MTASDLITIYLDGEATDAERSHLFEALATSSELQREFTAALAINTAAGRDARGMVPPDHVTASLFAKAFAPATETVVQAATTTWSFMPVLLLLGGVLTGTLLSLLTNPVTPERNELVAGRDANSQSRLETSISNSAVPDAITSRDLHVEAAGTRKTVDTRTASFNLPFVVQEQSSSSKETIQQPEQQPELAFQSATTPVVNDTRVHMVEHLRVVHVGTPGVATELALEQPLEHRRWSVSVRGMSTLQLFPGRSTATDRDMAFNNLGLGVRYALSEDVTIGAEVGQETFPVFVRTSTGDFAPRATLIWAAAVGRYSAPALPIVDNVRPFIQAGVGASPQGPVGRGTIGLSMMLANGLSMQAGLEATALAYQLDGAWSTTEKLGFTYGLTFQW
jgi:anti-sigma factor RsiW